MASVDRSHGLTDQTLHVDRFGLAIGPVSVGLPLVCTTDAVLQRYLDLLRLIQRGPRRPLVAPPEDLDVLAEATGLTAEGVAARLRALQV